jgi:RNA polymerase sigma-70 factor (sigma-E family)
VTNVLHDEQTGCSAQGVPIDAESRPDAGADAALGQLYDAHYVRLVRLAVLLLGDVGRAEEVVQDSFVAVYRRWDRLADADVPAYLRQTVVNRSRSVLRHLTVVGKHPPYAAGDGPGADEDVLRDERRRAVVEALGRLPRRQREVLALRYYLDLSEREIAQTLSISQGAVKSHASRGAAALRLSLDPLLEETS